MFWDSEHVPRLSKASAAAGGGLVVIVIGGLLAEISNKDWLLWACLSTGIVFVLFGILESIMLFLCVLERKQDAETRRLVAEKDVILALAGADQQTRAILGIKFPHYNFRWDGQKTETCWQDTSVPREIFWQFLRESTEKTTVPQRNWKAQGTQMHAYWLRIYKVLVEMDLIIQDSAAGPYSEFWRGNGYARACEMWPREYKEME